MMFFLNLVPVGTRSLLPLVMAPVTSASRPLQEWRQTSQIKKQKGCLLCNVLRKKKLFKREMYVNCRRGDIYGSKGGSDGIIILGYETTAAL
jgi:hypothetical protein